MNNRDTSERVLVQTDANARPYAQVHPQDADRVAAALGQADITFRLERGRPALTDQSTPSVFHFDTNDSVEAIQAVLDRLE